MPTVAELIQKAQEKRQEEKAANVAAVATAVAPRRRKGKKCVPCLKADAKALLLEAFPDSKEALAGILDCPTGIFAEFCAPVKRPASAYQTFMAGCRATKPQAHSLKEAQDVMRACAAEYRAQKGS